ncbi:MAG: MBG domain-containing protein, partial [Clostridia bacterium]|nr:MBG domain-containing protein [Clostridia bacterium]
MKKIFSLTLVLLMLVMTVVPVSANQDAITAEAVFTIGSTTAAPGDVVTLPISLKNTVLANSFGVRNFVYDESVLEFVGFEEAENLSNVFTLRTFNNDLKAILVGASQANTFDMALGNVKFKVNDSAADGDYTVNATSIAKNGSTDLTSLVVPATITVAKPSMEGLAFENATYTYDGTAKSLAVTGLPEGASVKYTSEDLSADGEAINAGTYNITATVTKDGYNTWTKTATLTIEKKDATITVNNAAKTIGQADPEFTYTVTGEATEGDITGIELTRAEGDAVGTYEIDAKYTANNNYNVTVVKGTLTISNKKIQHVKVAGVVENKTYGDDGFKVTVTPDTESGIDTYTITSSNTDVATVENGTVTIKGAGETTITVNVEGSEVYEPFEQSWTLTVAKKDATITVNNAAKTIGQTDPEFTYTVTGEATEGDITGIELTRAEGEAVGPYEIDAKYTANNNYNVTVVKGTLTINKKAQTLT